MNNSQRILLAVYIPITFLIIVFDNLYPGQNMVKYLKYTTMITLFLVSVLIRKKTREQKIMALAFPFLVIADFFLVFSTTFDFWDMNFVPLGIAGFLIAYLCLIAAYHKNFKVGKAEIITAIPIITIFLYISILLQPYVNRAMFNGCLVFGMVLCYMTWSSICTVLRNYFTLKTALLIAVSGIFMFICDLGVGISLFHPYYSRTFVPRLSNIVWTVYVLGWALLVVTISEENPLVMQINKD